MELVLEDAFCFQEVVVGLVMIFWEFNKELSLAGEMAAGFVHLWYLSWSMMVKW